MRDFTIYLQSQHTPLTVKRYVHAVASYLAQQEAPEKATYQDIVHYLGAKRKTTSPVNLKCLLSAIKKYYQYLIEEGIRADHPCKHLHLKDKKKEIQLQQLLSKEELQSLLKRKNRYSLLKTRNQVIMQLLVYQGLSVGELAAIHLKDIDLQQGTIHIQATSRTHSRTLDLKPEQILPLHKYIQEERGQLLKTPTEKLLITKRGTAENGEGITYLVKTYQEYFPVKKVNAKIVRQSVIAERLKEQALREVQVFAGHKYPSSTEKYKQSHVEQLKKEVLKFHPL